jgi:hypothetical protein
LLELTQEHAQKQKDELEAEYDRRIENGESVANLEIKMHEVDLYHHHFIIFIFIYIFHLITIKDKLRKQKVFF